MKIRIAVPHRKLEDVTISRRNALAALAAAPLLWEGCRTNTLTTKLEMPNRIQDIHSYGKPEETKVTSVDLHLDASFETRQLRGRAELAIQRVQEGAPLTLDTRDLTIERAEASGGNDNWHDVKWTLGNRDAILGAPLVIELPEQAVKVRIHYRTAPGASGLQWLTKEQTGDQKHPFLFSQNESIHARSWIPLQDSPSVRVTYTASVKAPEGLIVLMSADRKGTDDGISKFTMELPVPSYLIALAIGGLEFKETGPRSGVYAEPSLLPKAAHEFEDTEKLIAAVEKLYGPYRWGRYDLLILPPSFPFGGMENPRLTFATPTVIAGDKSLVSLVSHELAHSWSGNLVTNATWSDFWLNEGFTTYLENRIQEEVYGRDQALMEQVLARRELNEEIAEFQPRDQILHIDLSGRDPDDGSTQIPYFKGSLMLRQMEQAFTRPVFDAFLRSYFDRFSFQSIDTATMLGYMKQELFDKHPREAATIPVQQWIYQPGLPLSAPVAVSPLLQQVGEGAKGWIAGTLKLSALPTKSWATQQWLEFLQVLPSPLEAKRMAELDGAFHLTKSGNDEILNQWLQMVVKAEYRPAYARLESFLLSVGRMKMIRPLYVELMKTPYGKEFATRVYAKARPGYHPIAQAMVDKIVKPA